MQCCHCIVHASSHLLQVIPPSCAASCVRYDAAHRTCCTRSHVPSKRLGTGAPVTFFDALTWNYSSVLASTVLPTLTCKSRAETCRRSSASTFGAPKAGSTVIGYKVKGRLKK